MSGDMSGDGAASSQRRLVFNKPSGLSAPEELF
jgi:hypothetical protein